MLNNEIVLTSFELTSQHIQQLFNDK